MSSEQIIVIVMDDKTYNVNKGKLIEKSDYFRALYSSGMRESREDSVQLQGLSVPGLELVLEFINTSKVKVVNETLEDLIETASFLQVTSILKLLSSEIRQENCVELYSLSEVYGTHDLRNACLRYMSCHYHPMLRRPEFSDLPAALRNQVREMRMKGTATLVAIGLFTCLALDLPDQDEPWSMLRYGEVEQRWKPLANNLPSDMVNVRGYGSAVLDNYLFIVGGYRMTSQEISAAHCYNPCRNEWNQVAPLNQKRSNFKLLAVRGKLYAVGGQCQGTVECYSPEQDWWTCVSSLPDPLAEFSACECQGMIYVMGGYTARDRNTSVLRYCPTSDSWTVFRSCSAHVRKQQMLSVEDTIYLVGGYTHELEPGPGRRASQTEDMLTVQSYNVITGEWLHLKDNTSKSGLNLTCTLHNDGVYIMSRDVSLPTSLEHRVFLKYNIFSDAWEAFRRFPALGQNMLLCSLYLPNVL
ncbi:kelch-like protein 42 [Oncorhynchus tshawytscha]|uniref:Kelch-like family, member 42 n=3 Tax=Oncorhynchus TaxID=8016 RepID=A0A8C7HBT4_ONCKI|nr:kelch-like protein 42 [Oncorhynchus kisutch]XP_021432837.1 kelch-like protein 42 [Oncorhynchus mykiss]XP_024228546.1 kelch-like protein 42 [Oncorhynchus tshawytscha]XP_055793395.1 kelch-like protein 42 [Salvelinus fontinalis]|eukprot:XP_014063776.1 PREDICTED: kelch-like protein 42 [Salmo salar]